MRFAKTITLAVVLITGTLANLFAYDAKDLVSSNVYTELKNSGAVEKSYFKQSNAKATLAPKTTFGNSVKDLWTSNQSPVFVWEKVYLVPKSQISSGEATIDKVSKVLRSLSTLQGIQYYSSKNKWETLYKEAYCIKGPKDRTKVADDISGSADGKILYCMQNDNSFGKINYQVEYHQSQQEISATFSNTTPLYVGPVKGVSEDNLKISVVAVDCGSDMMFYLLVKANFPSVGFLEDKMQESLSSRLNALYNWLISKM